MQPIVTRTRQNEGGGGDLNATQSYNGKWCHPLPCWLWDHTGWRKIIEHLVLQALTPIVHHCARGHVIAVQPAGGGDTGRDSHAVSVTQGIQTSQPGFCPVQWLSDTLDHPLVPGCNEVFCQGVNLRGGECNVSRSSPKNTHMHAEEQQSVMKSRYPSRLLSFRRAYLLTLPTPPRQSVMFMR